MKTKYRVIAKVDNDKFVKYHIDNLKSFAGFLDRKWPDWRFFNVFDAERTQIASYTKNQRP